MLFYTANRIPGDYPERVKLSFRKKIPICSEVKPTKAPETQK